MLANIAKLPVCQWENDQGNYDTFIKRKGEAFNTLTRIHSCHVQVSKKVTCKLVSCIHHF